MHACRRQQHHPKYARKLVLRGYCKAILNTILHKEGFWPDFNVSKRAKRCSPAGCSKLISTLLHLQAVYALWILAPARPPVGLSVCLSAHLPISPASPDRGLSSSSSSIWMCPTRAQASARNVNSNSSSNINVVVVEIGRKKKQREQLTSLCASEIGVGGFSSLLSTLTWIFNHLPITTHT